MENCRTTRKFLDFSSLSPYVYLVKLQFLQVLAYRFEFFTKLAVNLLTMFLAIFLWRAAFRGIGEVSGVQERQMITYIIISACLSAAFSHSVQLLLYMRLYWGGIVTDLVKPIHLLGHYLAVDIGVGFSSLVLYVPAILVISLLLLRFPFPASFSALIAFIPSCYLSFGILWLMAALVGVLTFWTLELGQMHLAKDAVVTILSGSLVPIWFFPDVIQDISRYLPFQYTYQVPLGIYIGKISLSQASAAMLTQAMWIVILGLLLWMLWKRAQRKMSVQGG